MPKPFPHRYEADCSWNGADTSVLSAPPRPEIRGGAPPEFDGSPDAWNPDHLLLSALNLCMSLTFRALAAKAGVKPSSYRSRAEGVLDRTPEGLRFTAIRMEVEVGAGGADAAQVEKLVQSAKKHCIVANTLKPEIALEARVVPA